MNAAQKRDRGRLFTLEALIKLQRAIRDWKVWYEKECTQERIKELIVEEKLRQLGKEPRRKFLVSDRLKRKLQSERIGILIDNLEPALESLGKLIEAHRRYVELLRVLADLRVRSLTLITTRERLKEPSITVQHDPLRSLDVTA